MAISVDQLSVGTPGHSNAAVGSISMTTNVDIAAGALAVFLVSWFHATVTLSSGSIAGHACTVDQQQANGSDHIAIMSYYNSTGAVIPSGSTATATFSATVTGGPAISGSSFNGIDPAATTDGKVGSTSNVWATGSFLTTNPDDLLFSAAMTDGSATTATATAPATKATDFNDATAGSTFTSAYRIVAATGTYSIAGTWVAAGTQGCTVLVAYKAAPSASGSPSMKPLMLALKRFRPLWNPFPFAFPIPSIDLSSTAVIFNDSGSGTITLSGSGVQSFTHSGSASGTITLSGSSTQSFTHSGSSAGTITLSGSGVHSATFSTTAAGTITLTGAFTQSFSVSASGSGTITVGGSGSENYQPPGGVTYVFVCSSFLVALRRRGLL